MRLISDFNNQVEGKKKNEQIQIQGKPLEVELRKEFFVNSRTVFFKANDFCATILGFYCSSGLSLVLL